MNSNGLSAILVSICVALVGLLSAPVHVNGQQNLGAITGTVVDTTGAVVPSAQVTVTDIDRGVKRTLPATKAGSYSVPSLPAGRYRVEVEKEGFKKFVQEPVDVSTGTT